MAGDPLRDLDCAPRIHWVNGRSSSRDDDSIKAQRAEKLREKFYWELTAGIIILLNHLFDSFIRLN
jgi:hypothetical protein